MRVEELIKMNKVIFWDFQGTLAHNDWMVSKALFKVLCNHEVSTTITLEDFKSKPIIGFPWQNHEIEYLHLTNSKAWWNHAEKIFMRTYMDLNISSEKAVNYAKKVKEEFIKADEFILYEDTIETLSYFKDEGYRNIILSNHIPELLEIIKDLGLDEYIDICISSANVGYEKPNSKIFHYGLKIANYPREVWMVGDSFTADVQGGEGVGIKSILVRSEERSDVKYYSKDLRGVKEFIR